MKNFIIKMLLRKKQREVIWAALRYSEYRYRRHNRLDEAIEVRMTMEKVRGMVGQKSYEPKEVNSMVSEAVNRAVQDVSSKYEAELNRVRRAADEEIKRLRESLHVHAENNKRMGKELNDLKAAFDPADGESKTVVGVIVGPFRGKEEDTEEEENNAPEAEETEEQAPAAESKEESKEETEENK